eukprot:4253459-Pyramimonas_sp.AAC.1
MVDSRMEGVGFAHGEGGFTRGEVRFSRGEGEFTGGGLDSRRYKSPPATVVGVMAAFVGALRVSEGAEWAAIKKLLGPKAEVPVSLRPNAVTLGACCSLR